MASNLDQIISENLRRSIAEKMRQQLSEVVETAFGTTTQPSGPQPPLTMESLRRLCVDLDARMKRESLTVVVEEPHLGEMLYSRHPSEGARVECSYAQAVEIHKRWPLRLKRVLSSDTAEFSPMGLLPNMPVWITDLPKPPYETIEEEGL